MCVCVHTAAGVRMHVFISEKEKLLCVFTGILQVH